MAEITTEPLGPGTAVVAVTGEITFSNVAALDRQIGVALVDATNLVVDLTDVTFIDSSGLSTLLTASARAREHDGTVALVLARSAAVDLPLPRRGSAARALPEPRGRAGRAVPTRRAHLGPRSTRGPRGSRHSVGTSADRSRPPRWWGARRV